MTYRVKLRGALLCKDPGRRFGRNARIRQLEDHAGRPMDLPNARPQTQNPTRTGAERQ